MLKKTDIGSVVEAVELLPELADSLNEMLDGVHGREYTPEQLLYAFVCTKNRGRRQITLSLNCDNTQQSNLEGIVIDYQPYFG